MNLRTVNSTADLDALLTAAQRDPESLTDDQVHDLIDLVDTMTAALEPSIRVYANLLVDTVKAADYLLKSLPGVVLQMVLRPNEAIAAALAAADDVKATRTGSITLPGDPSTPAEPTPAPEPAVAPKPVPTPDEVPDSAPDTTSSASTPGDLASRPQYAA